MDSVKTESSEVSLATMAVETPVVRFVKMVLFQAIHDRATEITFRLHSPSHANQDAADDAQLHQGLREMLAPDEAETFIAFLQGDDEPVDLGFSEAAGRTTDATVEKKEFQITYLTALGRQEMAPPPHYLYAPVVRMLLHYTRHRFWIRGPVRGEIWLADPDSTWLLTAEDWRREITLKLVTERHEPAGEPGDDDSLLPPLANEPEGCVCLTHHQLPELAEFPTSQRTKLWRAFCQSRPMRWRVAARARWNGVRLRGILSGPASGGCLPYQVHAVANPLWLRNRRADDSVSPGGAFPQLASVAAGLPPLGQTNLSPGILPWPNRQHSVLESRSSRREEALTP